MGLEAGSFPSDLVDTNPTGLDGKAQGDDHLRLIKRVIKSTFPNINSAITASAAQINVLAGAGAVFQSGMIVMWSGYSIPLGWKLCNGAGTISNGASVPDLRDKFIIGAGLSYTVNGTGGTASLSFSGITTATSLSVAQLPPHTHSYTTKGSTTGGSLAGGDPNSVGTRTLETSSTGSGEGHAHYFGYVSASGNLPPFYALAFIIKN